VTRSTEAPYNGTAPEAAPKPLPTRPFRHKAPMRLLTRQCRPSPTGRGCCDVVPLCEGFGALIIEANRKFFGRSSTPRECDMKKLAVFGVVAGVVLAVTLLVRKNQSSESPEEREARRTEKRREMFMKMQAGMDAMPEDFPPVVMFNNVAATLENSERILELLKRDHSGTEEPVV